MQLPSQLLQRGNVVNTLIFPNVQVNLNVSFLLVVSHHKLSLPIEYLALRTPDFHIALYLGIAVRSRV